MKNIFYILFSLSFSFYSLADIYPPNFANLNFRDAAIKYGECMKLIKNSKNPNEELDCAKFAGSYEAHIALNYLQKFKAANNSQFSRYTADSVISEQEKIYKELIDLYKVK